MSTAHLYGAHPGFECRVHARPPAGARGLHRPAGSGDAGAARGAPLLMRMDPELALYGLYCTSRRLEEEGFEFLHPEIESALEDLLR